MNLNDLFLLVRVLRANLHAQIPVSILDGEGAASRRLQVANLIVVQGGAAIPTRKGEELGEALVLRVRREASSLRVVGILKPLPRPSCERCGAYMAWGTDKKPKCPFCDGGVEG